MVGTETGMVTLCTEWEEEGTGPQTQLQAGWQASEALCKPKGALPRPTGHRGDQETHAGGFCQVKRRGHLPLSLTVLKTEPGFCARR